MHFSKRASTQGYSVVIFITFIVLITTLAINTFRWNNKFGNRALGQEAMDMVLVEQNAELARIYAHGSAELALEETTKQFTTGGGAMSSEGVYPILKNIPLQLNFLNIFQKNLNEILFSNPYQISSDFSLYANFSNGTSVIGIGKPYTFLKNKPIQSLAWPVNSSGGKHILDQGCYGYYNSPVFKKIVKREGILIVSNDDKVYSVADNGKVVSASMLFQSNIPCEDPKTGKQNYNCKKFPDGNFIIVDYPNFKVEYARLKSINVLPGQSVHKGELLGQYGETGLPDGDALLLKIISPDGKTINPLCFYNNISFQNGKEIDCEKCNEKRYSTQIVFKVKNSFNISKLQKIKSILFNIKGRCTTAQDFSKCVETQVLSLNSQGHRVAMMSSCEKGPYKSYYNLSAFVEDCVSSLDTNCQCIYNLDTLSKLYPNIFRSSEEYFIKFQRTPIGTKIFLTNATNHKQLAYAVLPQQFIIKFGRAEKPLTNLTIDFTSNPYAKFKIGVLPKFTKKIIIVKNGTKIYLSPQEDKDINRVCSPSHDIARFCIDGLKFEINKQYYTTLR